MTDTTQSPSVDRKDPGWSTLPPPPRDIVPKPVLRRSDQDRLLFGVAGGLAPCERAPMISAAMDAETGDIFRRAPAPRDGAVIVGVAAPICSPTAKQSLHQKTGGVMVDMESHVFARVCAARDWPWAIVRGVSDGPDESLPVQCLNWIDSSGRTRAGRVALDLLRCPAMLPDMARLGRSTRIALDAASVRLIALLDELSDTITRP